VEPSLRAISVEPGRIPVRKARSIQVPDQIQRVSVRYNSTLVPGPATMLAIPDFAPGLSADNFEHGIARLGEHEIPACDRGDLRVRQPIAKKVKDAIGARNP
jgi:hypothetical protein